MGDIQKSIEQAAAAKAEARRRELTDQGLGGFAEFIAHAEQLAQNQENWRRPAPRPADPRASRKLSDVEKNEFESRFQSAETSAPGASSAEPAKLRERSSGGPFADAFRIAGAKDQGPASQGTAPQGPTSHASSPRRGFNIIVEPKKPPQAAEAEERKERPVRPRPEGAAGFDLGAYYDRIGLAQENAAALDRVLAHDGALDGAPRSDRADLDRLERLLAELDIKLPEGSPEQGGAETAGPDAGETPDARRLREALEKLGSERAFADGPICAMAGERLALVLDKTLTRQLGAASSKAGETPGAYALGLLAKAAPRAVPDEAPVAGSASFCAA